MFVATLPRPVRIRRKGHTPDRQHKGLGPAGAVVAFLLLPLTACGGSEPAEMPDVKTRQLDIALSDIKRAGFEEDVEVVGGGTFGVVDESAWTVCQQEPAVGTTIGSPPRLIVDRTCDKGDSDKAAEESETQDDTAGTNKTGAKPEAPKPAQVETFTMPALVGANLQAAQDMLQALDSYLLTQTDATGMERFQVLDSGWKVCGQRPRAGASVPVHKMVELFVVKLGEACP